MSIWYDCGNGWTKTYHARTEQLIPAYLVCPGPSLASVDFDIRGPGRFILGINTSYPKVIPDAWIGLDSPTCYDASLFNTSFPKYMRAGKQQETLNEKPISKYPNVNFLSLSQGTISDIFTRRTHEIDFVWQANTLTTAIHYLIWSGYKTIHLVGCDMGGRKDYYDDRKLSSEQRRYNRTLYKKQIDCLKVMAETGLKYGITFISNTPDSPINEFIRYEDLKTSIAQSPQIPAHRILHCLDTVKKNEKITVACVLKSGGAYTVEYVKRLYEAVSKNLTNFDFICLSDIEVPCRRIPLENNWPGWWSKLELFNSLKGKTLYIDLDTIINGSLEPFKNISDNFVMLNDFLNPEYLCSGILYWNGNFSSLYNTFKCSDVEKVIQYYTMRKANDFDRCGDQAYIRSIFNNCFPDMKIGQTNDIPNLSITSYKAHTYYQKMKSDIICYHGSPKPHETNWAI